MGTKLIWVIHFHLLFSYILDRIFSAKIVGKPLKGHTINGKQQVGFCDIGRDISQAIVGRLRG